MVSKDRIEEAAARSVAASASDLPESADISDILRASAKRRETRTALDRELRQAFSRIQQR